MNPESIEIKDCPDFVFWSVTRKMREPNVGSVVTLLAGPRAGAGGTGLASVPVYAVYVDGAVCAFAGDQRELSKIARTAAKKNLLCIIIAGDYGPQDGREIIGHSP
jgi:hypothetical protein